MKKYKHKKTGIIVEIGVSNKNSYYAYKECEAIAKWVIEDSLDWEEVKEPNYLITAFKRENSFFKLNKDGRYYPTDGIPVSWNLKTFIDEKFEIYSVKNSKGEEFTIGDKVNTAKDKFHISKFEVCGKQIIVRFKETDEHDGLDIISKVKSPIYITTDGVEMFEKNFTVLYLLSKELTIPSQNIAVIHNFSKQDKEVADRYLTFTSEKNRFNYIEDNNPKYSLNDIENCYPHANVTGNRIKDIPVVATLFSNLKKLGK